MSVAPPLTTERHAPVPHRVATTLLGLGVPTAATGGVIAIAFGWADRLPEPVAISWDSNGPKEYASLLATTVGLPAVGLLVAVIAWLIGVLLGQTAMTRRVAVATAVWASCFVSGLTVAMLAAQIDLADASEAGPLGASVAVTIAASLALAALAAFVMPGDPARPATEPVPTSAPHLDLPDTAQATWVRQIESVTPFVVAGAVVTFTCLVGAVDGMWWLGLVAAAVVGPILVAMTGWTVTVDHRGMTARARLPRPNWSSRSTRSSTPRSRRSTRCASSAVGAYAPAAGAGSGWCCGAAKPSRCTEREAAWWSSPSTTPEPPQPC